MKRDDADMMLRHAARLEPRSRTPWVPRSMVIELPLAQAEIWRRIAADYADNRHVIGYDLLNEPIPKDEEYSRLKFTSGSRYYKEVAAAIRHVDKNHHLFLSGAQWASNFAVFNDVNF